MSPGKHPPCNTWVCAVIVLSEAVKASVPVKAVLASPGIEVTVPVHVLEVLLLFALATEQISLSTGLPGASVLEFKGGRECRFGSSKPVVAHSSPAGVVDSFLFKCRSGLLFLLLESTEIN